MVQDEFNTKKKSVFLKYDGTEILKKPRDVPEKAQETSMKISPIITNIGVSLLVMAFLAVCFHL